MELSAQEINTIDVSSLDFTPDKKRYIFLAKKDKIDFIYNTSALEGNMMTYPEVETLLEGITFFYSIQSPVFDARRKLV